MREITYITLVQIRFCACTATIRVGLRPFYTLRPTMTRLDAYINENHKTNVTMADYLAQAVCGIRFLVVVHRGGYGGVNRVSVVVSVYWRNL